jgi:hypothetical protein
MISVLKDFTLMVFIFKFLICFFTEQGIIFQYDNKKAKKIIM